MNTPANTAGARKIRVLVIAEAANPEWTSVPLVGWNLYHALAKVADVHLVTQVRNVPALLRKGLIEGRDFTALDNETVAAPLYGLAGRLLGKESWTALTAFSSLAYYSFEWKLWRIFGDRLAAREFDVVHRITPLSPTAQSLIARKLGRLGIPFVLGPLNGGIPWPKEFRQRQYAEKEYLSHVRSLYRLMPFYRSTLKHSAAIISGSTFTQSQLPAWVQSKSIFIPENGVDLGVLGPERSSRAALPLRGAFVGRLVPYKGADVLLEAARPFLEEGRLKLDIIGDGPQKSLLAEKAKSWGVEERVVLHGWVQHADVGERLRQCDFLALPSVREFGGGVVVEAMSLGLAPIVADYGGPADLVDDTNGFRVPFTDELSLIAGFRSAVAKALTAPDQLDVLGSAARTKATKALTWDAKAAQILAIYQAVLDGVTEFGRFGFKAASSADA